MPGREKQDMHSCRFDLSQQLSNMDAKAETCTCADQKLQDISKALKEAKKCLRRDWEHLAPRNRSAQSRVVKELEQQKRSLEEEIEMDSSIKCSRD